MTTALTICHRLIKAGTVRTPRPRRASFLVRGYLAIFRGDISAALASITWLY